MHGQYIGQYAALQRIAFEKCHSYTGNVTTVKKKTLQIRAVVPVNCEGRGGERGPHHSFNICKRLFMGPKYNMLQQALKKLGAPKHAGGVNAL